jgi:hypothetical protein
MAVLARSAIEVCRAVPLSVEARALLKPQHTAKQFLDELVAKHDFQSACKLLAHALPKREAIWWACVCVRQVPAASATPEAKAALTAAERWVSAPTEENRRAAQAAAEVIGFGTPTGCTALAAFFSGGSLGPPNVAEVAPPEHLMPAAVAGAVLLVGVMNQPEKAPQQFARFCALGVDVDGGKNRWPEGSAARPASATR